MTIRSIVTVLLFLVVPGAAEAGSVESLVMPGKVIKGHAKYENNCKECHEPFSKSSQRRLCIGCHKKVAADIELQEGFHGRLPAIQETECKHCHPEHQGREADVIQLDKDVFDHEQTDFVLKGIHLRTSCERCHVAGEKYRAAEKQCHLCHKKNEPHQGRLGEKCEECHEEQSWKLFRFDHAKTKFPLIGVHQQVSCRSCHPGQRWQKTPTDCFVCHRLNDVHGGRYGEKCNNCHTQEISTEFFEQDESGKVERKSAWKNVFYDHDKTRFPLRDKHVRVACLKCHTDTVYDKKKEVTCAGCHQNDDFHKGRFGTKCEECHTPALWKNTKFDHNKTKFSLQGRHEKVTCMRCHTKPVAEQKLPIRCEGCHELDDKHRGMFGVRCDGCHTPQDWKQAVYDHNKTKFPLMDKHGKLACDKCHKPANKGGKLQIACVTCHLADDYHKGKQGTECERCHNPRDWRSEVLFDHDLTSFPLIGLHAIVPCEECHQLAAFKETPKDCITCHLSKDEHKLRLGPLCSQCHNPNGWNLWRFDHDLQSKFKLDGAHQGLECLACHKKQVQKRFNLSTACFSCHKTEDLHLGRFGKNCDRCHLTKSFKELMIGR